MAAGKLRLTLRIAGVAAAVLLLAAIGWLIYRLIAGHSAPPRKTVPEVVQLRLLVPPPPPPPPPPPQPKMVEQPKLKEPAVKPEQPMEKAEPKPASPPPGPPSLDAKGQGAGDAFGLGGSPGGSDYLGGGGGGGGGGSKYGWYAAMIQGHVQGVLQKQAVLQRARFRIGVQIWLTPDGRPERVELIGSAGGAELDRLLKESLLRMPRLPQAPPQDLPQPVVLQVSSS